MCKSSEKVFCFVDSGFLSATYSDAYLLPVILKEIRKASHCILQNLDTGKIDNAEVVGLIPVESAPVDNQQFFLPQQVQRKLLIVLNIELFHIQLRENIKSGLDRKSVV